MRRLGGAALAAFVICQAHAASAAELRDPTRPSGLVAAAAAEEAPAAPAGLRVSMIRSHGNARSAVLNNGVTVREGDFVGTSRVTHIGPRHITLEQAGQETVVAMLATQVKRSAAPGDDGRPRGKVR